MPFESAFKGIHVIARDDGIPLSMHSTAQLHPQSPYWGFDPGTTLSPNPSILDPSDGGCLADLDQRSCSTPGPNSTGMGVVRGIPSWYLTKATQAYSAWPSLRG